MRIFEIAKNDNIDIYHFISYEMYILFLYNLIIQYLTENIFLKYI